ncbi:EAL domain-containing protein [Xanthobacter wiegelii]|uniref:EAL domain-containing protein n=1 Tax=Xanthobacter wiegelii TaxID=3119913 RepID=UPI0037291337
MVAHSSNDLPLFKTAFQPIVTLDNSQTKLFGYEALGRGLYGEPAERLFSQVPHGMRYAMDAALRAKAVEDASKLGLDGYLSLNISAGVLCNNEFGAIKTIDLANRIGLPIDRLIFEITEDEPIQNFDDAYSVINKCRELGALVAIDDFGAGFNGLNVLLQIMPDFVKLDTAIVSQIEFDVSKRRLAEGFIRGCKAVGISTVAEGVESLNMAEALWPLGISHMQGYLFGKPAIGMLPSLSSDLLRQHWSGTDERTPQERINPSRLTVPGSVFYAISEERGENREIEDIFDTLEQAKSALNLHRQKFMYNNGIAHGPSTKIERIETKSVTADDLDKVLKSGITSIILSRLDVNI